MTWANGRQLTRVRGDSSFEVNYTYDGDGLRTSKSGARNTEYIILGGTYIDEESNPVMIEYKYSEDIISNKYYSIKKSIELKNQLRV